MPLAMGATGARRTNGSLAERRSFLFEKEGAATRGEQAQNPSAMSLRMSLAPDARIRSARKIGDFGKKELAEREGVSACDRPQAVDEAADAFHDGFLLQRAVRDAEVAAGRH